MRNWQVRTCGINIDRGHINFDFWSKLLQIKPADSASTESKSGLKFHRNPLRVLADLEHEVFRIQLNLCLRAMRIRSDAELCAQVFPRTQRILRSGNERPILRCRSLERNPHSAFTKLSIRRARRTKTKCSLTAFQVGYTHSGKQHSRKFLRRKRYRNTNDRTEDSSLTKAMPKRCPAPHSLDFRFAQRQRIFAYSQAPLWFANLCGRKEGEIIVRIPRQKVIDVVLSRIYSSLKRRPCHGRNCRKRRTQRPKSPVVTHVGEVRHSALIHESGGKFGVHAIETDNHNPLHLRFSINFAPTEPTEHLANWPSHQRVKGVEESDEQSPKGR